MRKTAISLALPLAASLALAGSVDRDFNETFDVTQGSRLRLTHGDGDVRITPWDRDVLEIDVRYHLEYSQVGLGGRQRDFDVEFERRGDEIVVRGVETGPGFNIGFNSSRRYEYSYTIQAPAWLALALTGDDGDVSVSGWRGPIEATLDDGDVELADVEAPRVELTLEDGDLLASNLRTDLALRSDDGDVTIRGCRLFDASLRVEDGDVELDACEGNLTIRADDGDIVLRDLAAGALVVRTEDGDVAVSLLPSSEPLDLDVRTDGGSVDLELAQGVSAEFELSADRPPRVRHREAQELLIDGDRARGRIGAGNGRIVVVSDDGGVLLRGSGDSGDGHQRP